VDGNVITSRADNVWGQY